mmetsp:Transcript_103722/g.291843  ORF Transcript_103722/g.291843 Transcript_103722/m.291843 type:complete len:403 (+) Transcript_103722:1368-2576(+)
MPRHLREDGFRGGASPQAPHRQQLGDRQRLRQLLEQRLDQAPAGHLVLVDTRQRPLGEHHLPSPEAGARHEARAKVPGGDGRPARRPALGHLQAPLALQPLAQKLRADALPNFSWLLRRACAASALCSRLGNRAFGGPKLPCPFRQLRLLRLQQAQPLACEARPLGGDRAPRPVELGLAHKVVSHGHGVGEVQDRMPNASGNHHHLTGFLNRLVDSRRTFRPQGKQALGEPLGRRERASVRQARVHFGSRHVPVNHAGVDQSPALSTDQQRVPGTRRQGVDVRPGATSLRAQAQPAVWGSRALAHQRHEVVGEEPTQSGVVLAPQGFAHIWLEDIPRLEVLVRIPCHVRHKVRQQHRLRTSLRPQAHAHVRGTETLRQARHGPLGSGAPAVDCTGDHQRHAS